MKILLIVLLGNVLLVLCNTDNLKHELNNTGKDMFIINAMVYQVGIISNKTNQSTPDQGNQEAFVFYPKPNSSTQIPSQIPLNKKEIPKPLVTEVTVQRFIGLAPLPKNTSIEHPPDIMPLSALQNITFNRLDNLKNPKSDIVSKIVFNESALSSNNNMESKTSNMNADTSTTSQKSGIVPLLPLNLLDPLNNILV